MDGVDIILYLYSCHWYIVWWLKVLLFKPYMFKHITETLETEKNSSEYLEHSNEEQLAS